MNIWMLYPTAGGPNVGRHWRPYWLAKYWQDMGHQVTIISQNSHHLQQNQKQPVGKRVYGEVCYWFVPTLRYNSSISRLLSMLSFGPSFAYHTKKIIHACGRPDIVIASCPHLFQVPCVQRVARRLHAKFWLEIRDLWPKSIIDLGLLQSWHPLVLWLQILERYSYQRADKVISLLKHAEPYMRARGLKDNGDFTWIPNGFSLHEYLKENQTQAETQTNIHPLLTKIHDLKNQDKRIFIYTGAMGPPNALELLIQAAQEQICIHHQCHFLLIGEGSNRQSLQAVTTHNPHIHFFPEVPRTIVHLALQKADCALLACHNLPLYDYGISPNKLFEYALYAPRILVAATPKALEGLELLVTQSCMPEPAHIAQSMLAVLSIPATPSSERIQTISEFNYQLLAKRYLQNSHSFGD